MDDPRIGYLLDQMLDQMDADGRFQSYASERSSEPPVWAACTGSPPTPGSRP